MSSSSGMRSRCSVFQSSSDKTLSSTRPLHETIQHHLPPGLVEIDGELVAVDDRDGAGAEFLVEDSRARRIGGRRAGALGDELAVDQHRAAGRLALAVPPAEAPAGRARAP